MPLRIVLSLIALLALTDSVQAQLTVEPSQLILRGPRSMGRIVVARQTPDGWIDITHRSMPASQDDSVATATPDGRVVPRGTGSTMLRIRDGADEVLVPVRVEDWDGDDSVDFRTDVLAALSKAGCNQGSCHGSPQGKNGFRLSLRGFDPQLDFMTLTHEDYGRRTNPSDVDASLVLKKGLGELPHQGGRRFQKDGVAYQLVRHWIEKGCPPSPPPTSRPAAGSTPATGPTATSPRVTRLEVLPGSRRLAENSPRQQLIALAHFEDGQVRDVTDLTVFSTNEKTAADINDRGLVTFSQTAEVAFLARYLDRITGVRLTYVKRDPAFQDSGPARKDSIDRHIAEKQRSLQLRPSGLADDATFLRRVFLDVTGTLPQPDEARRFLDSNAPAKRSALIDDLLSRDEFALFWALKWADLMRGSEVTISTRGVHSFHRYLVARFREDRPFDEFARQTLSSLGNTLYQPGANFHRIARTPDEAAEAMSQLFLGVRIGCAKCHNHPFEAITQDDYYGFAAYFARVRFKGKLFMVDDEIVTLDRQGEIRHPATNAVVLPAAFGEPAGPLQPDDDRREQLVAWLTRSDNRYFARSIVNRAWYHLFHRGLVDPVDDFRDTNPPSHPELLDELAADFVASGYRLKPVLRRLLNSDTYQQSSQGQRQSPHAARSDAYFVSAPIRMLSAEQLLDAISSATGTSQKFPGHPEGLRALDLAEGAIEHPFLKAFSRPVRDVTCECAREEDPSLGQVIHLMNNRDLLEGIRSPGGRLSRGLAAGRTDADIVEEMYLATVARRPTEPEWRVVREHLATVTDREAGLADVQHALLMSNEFLLQH